MKCPNCDKKVFLSQQMLYVLRRAPLTCKRCRSEVIPKPSVRYSFIVAVPIMAMFFVIDPILWGGPTGRHVKYLSQFCLDLQFIVVLTATLFVTLILGVVFLPSTKPITKVLSRESE